MLESLKENDIIEFEYLNYKGETSKRYCLYVRTQYGSNEWYPTNSIFLFCYDRKKFTYRSFAVQNIVMSTFKKSEV